MRLIWKYPLDIKDEQVVDLPINAQLLSVQEQNGQIVLWAIVEPNRVTEEIKVRIYGTGHPLAVQDDLFSYLGTVQTSGGSLVWHVFFTRE